MVKLTQLLSIILTLIGMFLSSHSVYSQNIFNLKKHSDSLSLTETPFAKFTEKGMEFKDITHFYEYTLPFYYISQTTRPVDDYTISTVIKSNNDTEGFKGIMIVMDGGHRFMFGINDRGRYKVSQVKNSERNWTTVQPEQRHGIINRGKGAENKLTYSLRGSNILFSINDRVMVELTMSAIREGNGRYSTGLAFIKLFGEEGASFIVEDIEFNIEPSLRKVSYIEKSFKTEPTLFPKGINNAGVSNLNPVLSADGNKIFFVRGYEYDEAYMAKKDKNGNWGDAEKLPDPINLPEKHRNVEAANTDGSAIYVRGVTRGNYRPNGVTKYEINSRGQWKEKDRMTVVNFNNINPFFNFFMSNDGQYLLTLIDDGSGKGDKDIHICFNQGKNFSRPRNLGPQINTAGNETYAFLAPDDVTLYYATEGLPGYGGHDIYMSKRLDSTWRNWSEPVNLGLGINSTDWEGYFTTSASGELGVISTMKDSDEARLLYFELEPEVKPDPVIVVTGTILDKTTGKPVKTTVKFSPLDEEGGEELEVSTNPETGTYSLVLQKGKKYEVLADKKGYFSVSEYIDLTDLESFENVERDLNLAKIEVGKSIKLNNIFFEYRKYTLKNESKKELDRLLSVLMSNPNLKIEISGHTDSLGDKNDNRELSLKRAKSVVQYLIDNGISSDRLQAMGYGEDQPIADNNTEDGRSLNRRVEFKVTQQ
jgi:outer membrane protein OmpA-like peptidoglycan-associated protein